MEDNRIRFWKEHFQRSGKEITKEACIELSPATRFLPHDVRRPEAESYHLLQKEYCLNLVLLAFKELGLQSHLEVQTPVSALVDNLGIHKKYNQLLKYLLKQLELEGYLSFVGLDTWRMLEPFPEESLLRSQIKASEESIVKLFPERIPFLELCKKSCVNLPQILKNEENPIKYFFSDEDDGADFVYSKLPEVCLRDSILEKIISSLNVKPSGKVNVLEISIGRDTATTSRILSALDHVPNVYTATRPSKAYTRAIASKLPSQISTQILDIEYDPRKQGFDPKSYDLIIAINCLHTTRIIKAALSHIQQLLKQDGILILCERTQPRLELDLVFGLTNDWWRFEDSERTYPLLQLDQWIQLLEKVGFDSFISFENPESITVCKYSCRNKAESSSIHPWIVLSNEIPLTDALLLNLGENVLTDIADIKASKYNTFAGVITVSENDMSSLETLASNYSFDWVIKTKVLVVVKNSSRCSLYETMTPVISKFLAAAMHAENFNVTLLECEEFEAVELSEIDVQVFSEMWNNLGAHQLLFKGLQLYRPEYTQVELNEGNPFPCANNAHFVLFQNDDFVTSDLEISSVMRKLESFCASSGSVLQVHKSISEMAQENGEEHISNAVHVTLSNSLDDSAAVIYDVCQLHKVSSDLRFILISAEYETQISWFCRALVHFRSRHGLSSSFVTLSSCDYVNTTEHILLDGVISVIDTDVGDLESYDLSNDSTSRFNLRKRSSSATRLIGKSKEEQAKLIMQIVLDSLSDVSGLAINEIDDTQGFQEMGLDSITIIQLVGRLEAAFQIELQVTSVFDQPTPKQLVKFLQELLDGERRNSRRQSSYVQFDEDIAIVGASCRAGPADTLDTYWEILAEGRDCITDVPGSRFNYNLYKSLIYNHSGSFINNVDGFDCNFFQVSPNEAEVMDPQQRLLLQMTWEALENANIPPDALEGSKTGVFVGMCNHDYKEIVKIPDDAAGSYCVTSNLQSVTAGRISYFLGLQGPSICVDTACSSSLVAVHLACSSILQEESSLAIVGGINLILSPVMYINYCKAKMLSKGRVCRPFDNAADGLVRGEGAGVIILKRLADAWTDGDNILGVIRGSGVNQDGASAGLTAPNGQAQSQLIRRVMKKSNLVPSNIGYMEAHGTGTALGDPIEVNALETIFNDASPRGRNSKGSHISQFYIGSVKANVGHTEAAAGILGLLKVCLALQHNAIPPQINVQVLNHHIKNPNFFQIPKQLIKWDKNKVGAVSSFGVSGTNAFAIIEEAPDYSSLSPNITCSSINLVTISAKNETALSKLLALHEVAAERLGPQAFSAYAYTTNVGRTHFRYRIAVLAKSLSDFQSQILHKSYVNMAGYSKQNICFMFTGQGSHYKGMGRGLYEGHPLFREIFDNCSSEAHDIAGISISDIFSDVSDVEPVSMADLVVIQAGLFSLEYSLAQLWIKLGITPTYLIGHSLGEYVAAAVAEILTVRDALFIIITRAKLTLQHLMPNSYGMLAVSEELCNKITKEVNDNLLTQDLNSITISAFNSPKQVVISGTSTALRNIKNSAGNSKNCVQLTVPYGYHSKQFDSISAMLRREISSIVFKKPIFQVISTVTGLPIVDVTTDHWVSHLVQPVLFLQAFKQVHEKLNCTTYLEIGPNPVLTSFCNDLLTATESKNVHLLYSLKPNENNQLTITKALSILYAEGQSINFKEMYPCRMKKVDLPTYPFELQSCWATKTIMIGGDSTMNINSEQTKNSSFQTGTVHPLVGAQVCTTSNQIIFENKIQTSGITKFLKGHQFLGKIVLPGAAIMEMAVEIAQMHYLVDGGNYAIRVRNFIIEFPIVLEETQLIPIQTIFRTNASILEIFTLLEGSTRGGNWKRSTTCDISVTTNTAEELPLDIKSLQLKLKNENPSFVWAHFEKNEGVRFGDSFKMIQRLWWGADECLSEINLCFEEGASACYNVHPVLLDSAFQTVFAILIANNSQFLQKPFMISYIDELVFHHKCPTHVLAYAHNINSSADGLTADISILSLDGKQTYIDIRGYSCKNTTKINFEKLFSNELLLNGLYEERWVVTSQQQQQSMNLGFLDKIESREFQFELELGLYEDLCISYINKALEELDYVRILKEATDINEFCAISGITSSYKNLVEHLFRKVGIQRINGKWVDSHQKKQKGEEPNLFDITRKAQSHGKGTLFAICNKCGENLAGILKGLINPLEIIFPRSTNSAHDVFEELSEDTPLQSILEAFLSSMQRNIARGTKLNVLEVGSGNGTSTAPILKALRSYGVSFQYTFTDIYTSYFPKAIEKFGDEDVSYEVLDIERDPRKQGFVPFNYDFVIAANVLHATEDVLSALSNARMLIRPGGLILLQEVTQSALVLDLTFGLTEDWWRFVGKDVYRKVYPLLSCNEWKKLLLMSNFESAKFIEMQYSVIIGKANENYKNINVAPCAVERPIPWLVVSACSTSTYLSEYLVQLGETVINMRLNSLYDINDRLVNEIPNEVFCVIFDAASSEDARMLSVLLLNLVQGLLTKNVKINQKLLIVTRGAVQSSLTEGVQNPFQSVLWGMARSIRSEHPELRCVTIDCEKTPEIYKEVFRNDNEAMVVIGNDGWRRNPRLTQIKPISIQYCPQIFSSSKTHLITGAQSQMITHVVQWMYHNGARRFCLLTRRPPDNAKDNLLKGLYASDLDVEFLQCDVADKASLRAIIQALTPSLSSIFHLAGSIADRTILNQTIDTMDHVYKSKVIGTWNLHQITLEEDIELDYFVLFSSVASLIGTPGQANYCAANAFMDSVAHFRKRIGKPATTINWGVWEDIGLSRTTKLVQGLKGFKPHMALSALRYALVTGATQLTAAIFDWKTYDTLDSKWYTLVKPEEMFGISKESPKTVENGLIKSSRVLSLNGMRSLISDIVKNLTGFKQVHPDSNFAQLGLDSLMIIELRNRLQKQLKTTISMITLFENPTVETLSTNLISRTSGKSQFKEDITNSNVKNIHASENTSLTQGVKLRVPKFSQHSRMESEDINANASAPSRPLIRKHHTMNGCGRGSHANHVLSDTSTPVSFETHKIAAQTSLRLTREGNASEPRITKKAAHDNDHVVSIIGLSCKMGNANNCDEYWTLLDQGISCITKVPRTRLEIHEYYETENVDVPYGSFINDYDKFDSNFFSVTKHEADLMDPQHRLLLQLCWHALEDAKIPPHSLKDTATGVFIGMNGTDYSKLVEREGNTKKLLHESPFLNLLGNTHCIAAGRISHFLGLQGPSLVTDTACSSSLVALHLAVRSLRAKESDLALVCGSNLLLSYDKFVGYARGKMLSSNGLVESFSTNGEGFVRGEGIEVLVLKRFEETDKALALIQGSAMAHVGFGSGLGAPSGASQVNLITSALADAGIEQQDVDYIEAQANGGSIADAVEINALEKVFGNTSVRRHKVVIGTGKPNIGHLEASSGLASVIKVIMSMQHRRIPPVINLKEMNPEINNRSFFNLASKGQPWPRNEEMTAAVASTGYAGTNAEVIMRSSVYPPAKFDQDLLQMSPFLFLISAKTPKSFVKLIQSYELLTFSDEDIPNISYSMVTSRSHFLQERRAFVSNSKDDLLRQLSLHKSKANDGGGNVTSFHLGGKVNFSAYQYEQVPVFQKHFKKLVEICNLREFGIRSYLSSDKASLEKEFASQFLLGSALLDLGIVPDVISGEGVGELAAACLVGLIDIENAVRLLISCTKQKSKHVSFSRSDSLDWINSKSDPGKSGKSGSLSVPNEKIRYQPSEVSEDGVLDRSYWMEKCRPGKPDETFSITVDLNHVRRIYDWRHFILALADLFDDRVNLNLSLLYDGTKFQKLDLPLYPFEQNRHWYK